mgnify:CR=1 FL=1
MTDQASDEDMEKFYASLFDYFAAMIREENGRDYEERLIAMGVIS